MRRLAARAASAARAALAAPPLAAVRAFSAARVTSPVLLDPPAQWYPAARALKRRLILHVGPPNSGKTHAALQALCAAESGVFCAPLRLLAWEVASRVDAAGVPCSLLTGQERRLVPGGRHLACTTEMADVTQPVKVAVIDEIQLLGDASRGWAFTRALLGVPAEELHLCGDSAATALVCRLARDAGEEVEVREYSRLQPLRVLRKSVEDLTDVRKGDALVAFSRRAVHALRASVEELTPHRCCILYGGLPPTARAAQALAFNTPRSGYSVLASSDAIGMGLNLSIKRVVFSSLEKFDGESRRPLTPAEVKQIAGRAGRYGGRFAHGEVTTMRPEDLPALHLALAQPVEPLHMAGLFPPTEAILAAVAARPRGGLEGALHRLADAQPPARHYVQHMPDDVIALARLIAPFKLPPATALTLSLSPCDARDATTAAALVEFAATLADGDAVRIGTAIAPGALKPPRTQGELAVLEELFRTCDLYVWLAMRMPEEFVELELATALRDAAAAAVQEGLRVLARPPASLKRATERAQQGRAALRSALDAVVEAAAAAAAEAEAPARRGPDAWRDAEPRLRSDEWAAAEQQAAAPREEPDGAGAALAALPLPRLATAVKTAGRRGKHAAPAGHGA